MATPALGNAWFTAPAASYLLEVGRDEYVLRQFNLAAGARDPELSRLLGRSMLSLYADQPQVHEAARRCVASGETTTVDGPKRRYDQSGAHLTLRLTFALVEPGWVVLHLEDFTPPSADRAAAREFHERSRATLSAMADAVIVRSADGTIIACNDAAARMLGYQSEGELVGLTNGLKPGWDVLTEAGQVTAREDRATAHVLRTGEPVLGVISGLRKPDGETRWLRVSMKALRVDGANVGLVSTFADLTASIKAAHRLREVTTELELALESARMGTWRWELDAQHVTWSEGARSLFHRANREADHDDFMSMVYAEDRAQVLDSIARSKASLKVGDAFENEYRVRGDDDVVRWARLHGRVTGTDEARVVMGTVADVTARRALEDELQRAGRLESLGRLAGGIAHDFNNLLAAVTTSAELLEPEVPPSALEDVVTIRQAAERGHDLTRQLLAFARQQPFAPHVVSLAPVITRAERLLRRLVGPHVTLRVSTEPGLAARADPAQLEQVLVNLVVNAREAMPRGGCITVSLRSEVLEGPKLRGPCVRVDVEDDGEGMTESTRQRAFDPFFTTKAQGTGLGLASCYGIVQQHGGRIEVDSHEGRGTRVTIHLPRVDEPKPLEAASKSPVDSSKRGHVLLVDDDALVRKAAARALGELGYLVTSASSGPEALNLPNLSDVHLLVSDVSMPEMSGPEFARRFCALHPTVRVLFVSGYPEQAIVEPGLPFGFLPKPWTRDMLERAIAELEG